jgi:hypothetical protein
MAQIELPDELLRDAEQLGTNGLSASEFVEDAHRNKLASERVRCEFDRITDCARKAMMDAGLSEADCVFGL